MMIKQPPRWAIAAKSAMDNLRELSYWWYDRQDLDTGIGWDDDDVESILVAAPTLVLAQDDPRARRAFYIVSEQMWRQWGMDGDREVGYPLSIETGDVEHAAEPISFSQPNAALVEPGNPVYIQRCAISARNLLDWTGINGAGHRHFRAFYFGAGGVKKVKYYDCDIPMNARAVIPAVYVAWYNRDPEVMTYLREYADAWAEHAMDTSMGKPLGVVPSEVRFADDAVGGYSGRWDQIAGYRQFDWSSYHRSAYNMYYFFISMYMLTGEDKYLQPVRETVKHLAGNYGPQDASGYAAMYRSFTGLSDLDYLFADLGDKEPVWRWFARKDKDALADWCEAMAVQLRESMAARTIDLDLRDACSNYVTCVDDSVLRLMYTGGMGYQVGAYPQVQVSWSGVNDNFTALLLSGDKSSLDVLVYNFEERQRDVQMVVWNLEPGTYAVTQGADVDRDDVIDGQPAVSEVNLERWGRIGISIPPQTLYKIEVRRIEADSRPAALPDLAICADDVLCSKLDPKAGDEVELFVKVHNIGSTGVEDAEVEIKELPAGHVVWRGTTGPLPAPSLAERSRLELRAPWTVGEQVESIEVAVSTAGCPEITSANNSTRIRLSHLRTEQWVPQVRLYRDPAPPESPLEITAVRRTAPVGLRWTTNDPDWQRAPVARLQHRMYNDSGHISNSTRVRASYDEYNLYIFFSCDDDQKAPMVARLRQRDSHVWDDESVEITLDPHHDHEFYYHFAVNVLGTMYDAEMVSPFWDGRWDALTYNDDQGWKAQVTMPFSTLGITPESGRVVGINFVRTNYADADRGDRQTSVWQKIPGWTLRPAYFGHLRLE